jgi:hypothetical protein
MQLMAARELSHIIKACAEDEERPGCVAFNLDQFGPPSKRLDRIVKLLALLDRKE